MNESRRDFIKQASKAIAGTAILGSVDACSPDFQESTEYPFEHVDGNEAHKSGNRFSKRVGDILKEQHPCRVENPSVRIEVSEQKFKFVWNCNFVKCEEKDADFYFDRRGLLWSGDTPEIAHNNVEAKLKETGQVQEMIDAFRAKYGNHRMPDSFVSESISGPVNGRYWCVREFFCTAKK